MRAAVIRTANPSSRVHSKGTKVYKGTAYLFNKGRDYLFRVPSGMMRPIPQSENLKTKGTYIMGDKSPKANQKQASQKKAKNNSADQKKRDASAAKQTPGKKK